MRKHYSDQFKKQAIEHVLSHPKHLVVSIAQLLGVGYSTLDKWLRDYCTGSTCTSWDYAPKAARSLSAPQTPITTNWSHPICFKCL
jgi:transposase